jgi:hypothetical protein
MRDKGGAPSTVILLSRNQDHLRVQASGGVDHVGDMLETGRVVSTDGDHPISTRAKFLLEGFLQILPRNLFRVHEQLRNLIRPSVFHSHDQRLSPGIALLWSLTPP